MEPARKKQKTFIMQQVLATLAGTVLVKDINPGAAGSDIRNLTVSNGKLFFRANDGVNGDELWKSDGTAVGTVMVKDINPAGDAFFWVSTTLRPSPEV